MNDLTTSKHLPLTEATFYILLALVKPKHGYAVMQQAEDISKGTLKLGPGTLYGAFTTLESSKLIRMVGKEGRRKIYQITDTGLEILQNQITRLHIMLSSAENIPEAWVDYQREEG